MSFVRSASVAVFAVTAVLSMSGCGKSPEAVCKKLDAMSKSDDKQPIAECVTEMEEIKKASPKGYDCIAECSDRTSEEALGLCMFGCIAADKELEKVFEKQGEKNREKREAKDAEKIVELTKKPEKVLEGTIKSFSDEITKYSISLVEGYSAPKGETIMSTIDHEDMMLGAPHFTISVGSQPPAEELDSAIKTSEMLKEKVLKKESNDSGYTLHTEGDSMLNVSIGTKVGDKLMECKAMVMGGALKKKDELIPWIEKTCRSIKVK